MGYDIVADEKFAAGVSSKIKAQMHSTLQANLHIFNSKQQKILRSAFKPEKRDESTASVAPGPESRDERNGANSRDGRRKRSADRGGRSQSPPRVQSRSRSRSNPRRSDNQKRRNSRSRSCSSR